MTPNYAFHLAVLSAISACANVATQGDPQHDPDAIDVLEQAVDRGRTFELHQYGIGSTAAVPYNIHAALKVEYLVADDVGVAEFRVTNYGTGQALIGAFMGVTCEIPSQNDVSLRDWVLEPDEQIVEALACQRIEHADVVFSIDN